MNDYNNVLVGFSELIKNEEFRPYEGDLRLGVDLGTANIVVSVVDSNNTPIAGASYPSTVTTSTSGSVFGFQFFSSTAFLVSPFGR